MYGLVGSYISTKIVLAVIGVKDLPNNLGRQLFCLLFIFEPSICGVGVIQLFLRPIGQVPGRKRGPLLTSCTMPPQLSSLELHGHERCWLAAITRGTATPQQILLLLYSHFLSHIMLVVWTRNDMPGLITLKTLATRSEGESPPRQKTTHPTQQKCAYSMIHKSGMSHD